MRANPLLFKPHGKPWLAFVATGLVFMLSACGTMNDGRAWGEDATLRPGLDRVVDAAGIAAVDPLTWVPVASAVAIFLSQSDKKIERSLSRRTPVFGSAKAARDASDDTRQATRTLQLVTLLLTPSGNGADEIAANKARGFAVEFSAEFATKAATSSVKSAVGRERPGNGEASSFPSGHSSDAFSNAALVRENLSVTPMNTTLRTTVSWGATLLASATAYARVEGGVHYPTDVLVGAALGNFLTRWIYNAFIGTPLLVSVETLPDGAMLSANVRLGTGNRW